MSSKKTTLYDDSSSDEAESVSAGFTVNKEYEEKFQAKKQREELSKCK